MTSTGNFSVLLRRLEATVDDLRKVIDFIAGIDRQALNDDVSKSAYKTLCDHLALAADCALCSADSIVRQTKPNPITCECHEHLKARGLASQCFGVINASKTFGEMTLGTDDLVTP